MFNVWIDIYTAMQVKTIDSPSKRAQLQIVLHNGMLFFEIEGRPDGLHPQQANSYFELYKMQAQRVKQQQKDFELNEEACLQLFQELLLFYARCMAFLKLENYRRLAKKDAIRILRMINFLKVNVDAAILPTLLKFETFFHHICDFVFVEADWNQQDQTYADMEIFIGQIAKQYYSTTDNSLNPDEILTKFDEN